MAWQDTMIKMLRILVNDIEDTPTYSDGRLEQVLAVGAHYVVQEIDGFDYTYTVDISTPAISPDPTSTGEVEFTNFVVLKAACITDFSTFRTKALSSGIKVRCGPAVLETVKHLDGFKQLLDMGPCAAYEELKKQWMFGQKSMVKAILSPFVSNAFDPSTLITGSNYYPNHLRYYR